MGWFLRRLGMLIPSRVGVALTGDGATAGVRRVRPGRRGGPAGVACPPRPLLGRLRRRLLHGRVLPARHITAVTVVAVRAVAGMVELVPATAGRVRLGNLIIATMADVVRLVV